MFYRVIKAPPGYASNEAYMVGVYKTLSYDSFQFNLTDHRGNRFVATIEQARKLIPGGAKCLSCHQEDQFIELWENTPIEA